jgi:hypothetical protein
VIRTITCIISHRILQPFSINIPARLKWAFFGWTRESIHDVLMLFRGADFDSTLSFKETKIVRDDNEVTETCPQVVWSSDYKEEEGRR